MPMRMAYGNLRTVLILFDAANLMLLRPFHVCGLRTSALEFARLRMPPFAYLPSTASTLVVRQASNFAAAWCFQENLLSVLAACLALFQNGDPHMPGVPAYYIPRAQHLCQRCNLHALHHSDINVRHFMLGYPAMQPALRLNSVSPACFRGGGAAGRLPIARVCTGAAGAAQEQCARQGCAVLSKQPLFLSHFVASYWGRFGS